MYCFYSVKLLKNSALLESLVSRRSHKTPVATNPDSNYIAINPRVIEQMLLEGDPSLFAVGRLLNLACPKLDIEISNSLVKDIAGQPWLNELTPDIFWI